MSQNNQPNQYGQRPGSGYDNQNPNNQYRGNNPPPNNQNYQRPPPHAPHPYNQQQPRQHYPPQQPNPYPHNQQRPPPPHQSGPHPPRHAPHQPQQQQHQQPQHRQGPPQQRPPQQPPPSSSLFTTLSISQQQQQQQQPYRPHAGPHGGPPPMGPGRPPQPYQPGMGPPPYGPPGGYPQRHPGSMPPPGFHQGQQLPPGHGPYAHQPGPGLMHMQHRQYPGPGGPHMAYAPGPGGASQPHLESGDSPSSSSDQLEQAKRLAPTSTRRRQIPPLFPPHLRDVDLTRGQLRIGLVSKNNLNRSVASHFTLIDQQYTFVASYGMAANLSLSLSLRPPSEGQSTPQSNKLSYPIRSATYDAILRDVKDRGAHTNEKAHAMSALERCLLLKPAPELFDPLHHKHDIIITYDLTVFRAVTARLSDLSTNSLLVNQDRGFLSLDPSSNDFMILSNPIRQSAPIYVINIQADDTADGADRAAQITLQLVNAVHAAIPARLGGDPGQSTTNISDMLHEFKAHHRMDLSSMDDDQEEAGTTSHAEEIKGGVDSLLWTQEMESIIALLEQKLKQSIHYNVIWN